MYRCYDWLFNMHLQYDYLFVCSQFRQLQRSKTLKTTYSYTCYTCYLAVYKPYTTTSILLYPFYILMFPSPSHPEQLHYTYIHTCTVQYHLVPRPFFASEEKNGTVCACDHSQKTWEFVLIVHLPLSKLL